VNKLNRIFECTANIAIEKEKRMNARQANRISIRNYLESIGISPVKSNKRSSLYLAPYRAETKPSLKVSHDQNLWVDYGNDNKGGTLIDLVLKLNPSYNVSDAIRVIEKSTRSFFSFHQQDSYLHSKHEVPNTKHEKRNTKNEKAVNGLSIPGLSNDGTDKPCTHNTGTSKQEYLTRVTGTINIYKLQEFGNNPALTSYLNSRVIQVSSAKPFCREVYYTLGGKQYFGIGNQNDRGWSIRNKYWKGCTAQGYSFYKRGFQRLCVFEGIFDLLSFIELNKNNPIKTDFLVLNSLVNLKRAIPTIEPYLQVDLFLDHDQAGRNATKTLMDILPDSRDASGFYSSFKDLNDYYLVKGKEQLPIVKGQVLKDNCSPRLYEASHVLARPKRLLR